MGLSLAASATKQRVQSCCSQRILSIALGAFWRGQSKDAFLDGKCAELEAFQKASHTHGGQDKHGLSLLVRKPGCAEVNRRGCNSVQVLKASPAARLGPVQRREETTVPARDRKSCRCVVLKDRECVCACACTH